MESNVIVRENNDDKYNYVILFNTRIILPIQRIFFAVIALFIQKNKYELTFVNKRINLYGDNAHHHTTTPTTIITT